MVIISTTVRIMYLYLALKSIQRQVFFTSKRNLS
jgi:hypothetical protein